MEENRNHSFPPWAKKRWIIDWSAVTSQVSELYDKGFSVSHVRGVYYGKVKSHHVLYALRKILPESEWSNPMRIRDNICN